MVLYFSFYIKVSINYRPFIPYLWAGLMICSITYYAIAVSKTMGDDSPKYIQAVKLEQTMVKYMEQQQLQKNNIYCNFTMLVALKDKGCGFLSGDKPFINATDKLDKKTEYVIYTNIDYCAVWQKGSDTLQGFQVVKQFDYGVAHGTIFKRI